jgi:hypothetical protein
MTVFNHLRISFGALQKQKLSKGIIGLNKEFFYLSIGILLVNERELPQNAEAGYLYDSIRQQQKTQLEQIEKLKKLKRKMNKNIKLKR